MREIKFRALRTDGKGWVYGYYYEYSGEHVICYQDHSDNSTTDHWLKVIPESVGQFTGLKDKNETDIYEGDVDDNRRIMLWNSEMCLFCWHHWNEFRNGYFPSSYPAFKNEQSRLVVKGNIHTTNDKGKEETC